MNKVIVMGTNHTVAPLEFRERLALIQTQNQSDDADALCQGKTSDQSQIKLGTWLQGKYQIQGSVTLSTCNRVEIYATLPSDQDPDQLRRFVTEAFQLEEELVDKYTYVYEGLVAILHLFRVSSSLDSMILGEPQILGQIKEAYSTALKDNTADSLLHRLFTKAISVGKQIRTQTNIASGAVSVSYAAVVLAKQLFNHLKDKTVVIIGAGKMSELTVKHLVENGVSRVIVVNRSCERAERVAEMFNGMPMVYQPNLNFLAHADIVISSTAAPHHVIQSAPLKRVMQKRSNHPMFLIDIAVPRDISPETAHLENVHLYNIDDLQAVVDSNLQDRQQEAELAEKIASTEAMKFHDYLNSLGVTPAIKSLNQKFQQIAARELEYCLKKGNLNREQQTAVSTMIRSLIKKLLDSPTRHLRQVAVNADPMQQICLLRELFCLDDIDSPESADNFDISE